MAYADYKWITVSEISQSSHVSEIPSVNNMMYRIYFFSHSLNKMIVLLNDKKRKRKKKDREGKGKGRL